MLIGEFKNCSESNSIQRTPRKEVGNNNTLDSRLIKDLNKQKKLASSQQSQVKKMFVIKIKQSCRPLAMNIESKLLIM